VTRARRGATLKSQSSKTANPRLCKSTKAVRIWPLDALNAERGTPIKIRQNKNLNNTVEQDHRAIKRRTRPMLGFKNFRFTRILLSGIELMRMIAKGKIEDLGIGDTHDQQFFSLGT
jgi:transposase-like protein